MYQYKGLTDTIVAIATVVGNGGIGIIRISGKEAIVLADDLFRAKSGEKMVYKRTYTVHYGWIVDDEGNCVDEVLLTIMRGPKSYTTEDVVEISCHGGFISLQVILNLILDKDEVRLAEPGEFTKRAFLNGRIDLTQAEAVLDIVNSKTTDFLQVSANQLKGELSTELERIRKGLMDIYISMEAIVNFPEDDIDSSGRAKLSNDIEEFRKDISGLLDSSDQGCILREGIKLVLCGKPNVGKSSLLNVFLKINRAIVSDIEGTTRDSIEENSNIKGIPFQVVDTAGIIDPRNSIEEEAVKRSHRHIQGADLVLFVLDADRILDGRDFDIMKCIEDKNVLVVVNKVDLEHKLDVEEIVKKFGKDCVVKISTLTQVGIENLKVRIMDMVIDKDVVNGGQGILVNNLRHIEALSSCCSTLVHTQVCLSEGLSLEFSSEDIKLAVNYLDGITGRNIDVDLIDNIFSQFCIGK